MCKHSHLSWPEECFADSHVSEAAVLVNGIDSPRASFTPYTSSGVSRTPHICAHFFFESQDMHVEEDIIFAILYLKQTKQLSLQTHSHLISRISAAQFLYPTLLPYTKTKQTNKNPWNSLIWVMWSPPWLPG